MIYAIHICVELFENLAKALFFNYKENINVYRFLLLTLIYILQIMLRVCIVVYIVHCTVL